MDAFIPQATAKLAASELAEFTALSRWRSVLSLAAVALSTLALLVLGSWALAQQHWLVLVAVVLAMPAVHHHWGILAHEAVHYRLDPNRKLNDVLGWWCGAVIGVSMYSYRIIHRLHHNHLYQALDPDMALQAGYPRSWAQIRRKFSRDLIGLSFYKNYRYFFAAPAVGRYAAGGADPLADTSSQLRRKALSDRWRVMACQGLLVLVVAATGHGVEYLVLWLLPLLTLYQFTLRLRAICEHGAPLNPSHALTAARTNLHLPWPVALWLFPLSVNYHVEHHLYPAVPHYRLKALHQRLIQRQLLTGADLCPWPQAFQRVVKPS